MNRFRNQIAEPDPFTAFCNAAMFGCVAVANDNAFLILRSSGRSSPAHLGAARIGRAPFFVACDRLSGKMFGHERHQSVSKATPQRPHVGTEDVARGGKSIHGRGKEIRGQARRPCRFWRVIAPTMPLSAMIWISEYLSASAEYRARLSIWLSRRRRD